MDDKLEIKVIKHMLDKLNAINSPDQLAQYVQAEELYFVRIGISETICTKSTLFSTLEKFTQARINQDFSVCDVFMVYSPESVKRYTELAPLFQKVVRTIQNFLLSLMQAEQLNEAEI